MQTTLALRYGRYWAWLGSLALLPLCAYSALRPEEYTLLNALLNDLSLALHEGGHLAARPLSAAWQCGLGVVLQFAVPLVLARFFWKRDFRFGAQVFGFWYGYSFLYLSTHLDEVPTRQPSLLASLEHEWHGLLHALGIEVVESYVPDLFFGAAVLCFLVVLLIPLRD